MSRSLQQNRLSVTLKVFKSISHHQKTSRTRHLMSSRAFKIVLIRGYRISSSSIKARNTWKYCSKSISYQSWSSIWRTLRIRLDAILTMSREMPGPLSKSNLKLINSEGSYMMWSALSQTIFLLLSSHDSTITVMSRNLFLFISLTHKPQSRFLSEMLTYLPKTLLQSKHRIRYSSLVERRKKMRFDQFFQMSAMLLMNKSTRSWSVQVWLTQDLAISSHISIVSLSSRQKTTSMPLDQSTLMRPPRSVKCMILPRTNGLRYVILHSQGITTRWQCMILDTSMSSVVETAWTRLPLKVLRDLMDMLTSSSKSGSQYLLSTRTMLGLHVIPLEVLHSMTLKSWSMVEIMDGLVTASTSTLKPMWLLEWSSAHLRSQKNSSDHNQWSTTKKCLLLVASIRICTCSVPRPRNGFCSKSGILNGESIGLIEVRCDHELALNQVFSINIYQKCKQDISFLDSFFLIFL